MTTKKKDWLWSSIYYLCLFAFNGTIYTYHLRQKNKSFDHRKSHWNRNQFKCEHNVSTGEIIFGLSSNGPQIAWQTLSIGILKCNHNQTWRALQSEYLLIISISYLWNKAYNLISIYTVNTNPWSLHFLCILYFYLLYQF